MKKVTTYKDLPEYLRYALEDDNEYMLENLELDENPHVDTLLKSLNVNRRKFEKFDSECSIYMCICLSEAIASHVKIHNAK